MVKHGFPREWSTLKKLIWLQGSPMMGENLPWTTFSGNPLEFTAPKAHALRSATVTFEPIQSGSGDPSPDNVRPISGWTGVEIYRSGEDTSDYTTYSIPFGTTVYGGTASYNGDGTWTVTKTCNIIEMTGSGNGKNGKAFYAKANQAANVQFYTRIPATTAKQYDGNRYITAMKCTHAVSVNALSYTVPSGGANFIYFFASSSTSDKVQPRIAFPLDTTITTVEAANQWLAAQYANGTPVKYTYELATPTSFTVTTGELLEAIAGHNIMWTDGKNLTVEAKATAITP